MKLMTNGSLTYYQLLGVPPDATPPQIKKAYLAKAKKLHPDAGGNKEDFQLLNEAFKVLNDPVERLFYDRSLRPQAPLTPPPSPAQAKTTPSEPTPRFTEEVHQSTPSRFSASFISACILVLTSASYVLFRMSGLSLLLINPATPSVKNSWYVAWQHEVSSHAVVGILIAGLLFALESRTGILSVLLTLTRPLFVTWIALALFLSIATTGELILTPVASLVFAIVILFFLTIIIGGGFVYLKIKYRAPWANILKAVLTP